MEGRIHKPHYRKVRAGGFFVVIGVGRCGFFYIFVDSDEQQEEKAFIFVVFCLFFYLKWRLAVVILNLLVCSPE